jgi:hypothetical protein
MTGRAPAVLFVAAWAFWLHQWVPGVLVGIFVVWAVLHSRLEAGLGDALGRRWRRAWPPSPLLLSALLVTSATTFVMDAAPAIAKVVPVGLDVVGLGLLLRAAWKARAAPSLQAARQER